MIAPFAYHHRTRLLRVASPVQVYISDSFHLLLSFTQNKSTNMPSYNAFILTSFLTQAIYFIHYHSASALSTPTSPLKTPNSSSHKSSNVNPKSPIVTTGVDIQAWGNAFNNCPKELPPTIVPLPDLPSDFPTGTYYRNGHARFYADDGTPVLHPFDADGMIVAMTFDSTTKQMLFRNRFVESEGYLADKATGGMSERGLFGTMKTGGLLNNAFRMGYKHVANTNVIHAGDDLYALWEGGKPYVLDPLTLRNKGGPGKVGMTDLNGLVNENFSAHPRYDPVRKTYVNFGSVFNPIKSEFKVSLYEVDAETFRSRNPSPTIPNFVLGAPALLHDFILTENYCIFNINDTKINTAAAIKAMLGLGGFAGSLEVNDSAETTNIVLIPRSLFNEEQSSVDSINLFDDERIIVMPIDRHFNFHYANAYEDDDGSVVFDTVQIDGMELATDNNDGKPIWLKENPFDAVAPSRMVRYKLDLQLKTLAIGTPPSVLTSRLPEFPSIPRDVSIRKHRYVYPVTARKKVDVNPKERGMGGPVGGIAKIDAIDPSNNEYFSFEPYEFPSECVLCPKIGKVVSKPEEEDGCYLLLNIVNGRDLTTDLAIFDVEGKGALEKGPVLRFQLPVFVPHMLHGCFSEGVTFDFDAVSTE